MSQSQLNSLIPSPASQFNRYSPPIESSEIVYTEGSLTTFLRINGVPVSAYRVFLEDNQIANPFQELTPGRLLIVRKNY